MRRFRVEALQEFIDDPEKYKGSVRVALERILNETAADAFTLSDYARVLGATETNATSLLDGIQPVTKLMLCRVPFVSDNGIRALKGVCASEQQWLRSGGDPAESFDRKTLALSPLLLTAKVCAILGHTPAADTLSPLSADRYCLDGENLIDRPHPLAKREGAVILRFAA